MSQPVQLSKTAPPSTLDRLRRVAAELFAERGYSGTSMADIANGVGVRKASLYNYYAAKEEILFDLLERSLEAWKERCRPVLDGPASHRERLHAHLEAAVSFVSERPHEVAILRLAAGQIGGELGDRVTAILHDHEEGYARRLERFFADAAEAGEVEPGDSRELALAWKVFLDGLLINYVFCGTEGNLYHDHRGRLWELCWRGLAGGQAPVGSSGSGA